MIATSRARGPPGRTFRAIGRFTNEEETMTNVTMESLEASGFEGMIREGPDAFGGDPGPRPCFVHHRDAGGWCGVAPRWKSTESPSARYTARRSRPAL